MKPKEWPGDWRGAKTSIEERMIAQQSAACVGGLTKERRQRQRRQSCRREIQRVLKYFSGVMKGGWEFRMREEGMSKK